ncbi:MAG TPA: hypothetical protein PLG17_06675 [Thermodesulfobacteriota bacterium]|mgnify:CR=1 FL=1|nr:hypothetical protein [Thermodesulfobacteriota bacterium]HNU70346.1 hypothetical protein [Thermodesulfobacteriota bacterium]HQO78179.1 hypothetical protein [Thermodesulfobacteriota bacterium]
MAEKEEFEVRGVVWTSPGVGVMFPRFTMFEGEVYRVSLAADGGLDGAVWRGGKWIPSPFVEAEFKGRGLSEQEARRLTSG